MTDLEKLLAEATPGPWVYDSEDQGGAWGVNFSIQQAENRLVDVAEMVSDEANSRLIALAPQLAAALIKAEEALAAIAAYTNEPSKDFREKYPNLSVKIEEALRMAKERGASFMPEVVICDYARAALSEIEKLTGGGE